MLARSSRVLLLATALVTAPSIALGGTGGLGANCPSGALFASIECRLGSLIDWVPGSGTSVKVMKKLRHLCLGTQNQVKAAHRLSDRGRARPARRKLKKADRGLGKVETTLGTLVAPTTRSSRATTPPVATPAEALTFVQGVRTDVTAVRVSLGEPIPFATVCCIRACLFPPDGPGGCAIVDSYPCSDLTCLATGACLAGGCIPTPIPAGTTCAAALPVCVESTSCPAENANCVVP